MSAAENAPWELPAITLLNLVTVYGDGSTSLVSLAQDCVIAEFEGEHPQQGIPHVRVAGRMEREAATEAGQEYDGGWPGWGPVFRYLRNHPQFRDTSHWSPEVAEAVRRITALPPTGQGPSALREPLAACGEAMQAGADLPIYASAGKDSEGAVLTNGSVEVPALLNAIRDVLWLVGEKHTPDKEWRPETLEEIAHILTEAGLGPVADQPAPPIANLDDARRQAADDAFANYDLGDAVVADTCGWEHRSGGEDWSRVFFVEDPPGPSAREVFVVRFRAGSAEAAEAYWRC